MPGEKDLCRWRHGLFPAADETPEAAAALLKSEIKLWGDVIRANHIAAQ